MAIEREDIQTITIGSRSETICPKGYERIIIIVSHNQNLDYTKIKSDWWGRGLFNWQGSRMVTFKVESFAEDKPK
jgi:hypothetical protein